MILGSPYVGHEISGSLHIKRDPEIDEKGRYCELPLSVATKFVEITKTESLGGLTVNYSPVTSYQIIGDVNSIVIRLYF